MASGRPSGRRGLLPPTSSDSEPDIQIGDFVRGKEIGKGSFASVYLASHRKKRSYAAVKAVSQGKLTRKLKENLESEIRILKSLQHPHIVALFSCTETPSYIYLVMEYCQLSDLAQFMKKRTQLQSLPETADIFQKYPNAPSGGLNEVIVRHFVKQIASALEYLRNRNLIHRDIKPQNLLLNPSPAYMARQKPEDVPLAASEHSLVPAVGVETLPMLKIADFGFARHLPQQMLAETLCGSPLYMAPEILSYQKYDAIADLWSVGAVTYEMSVGKPPFRAANHIELLKKIDDARDVIPFPAGLVIGSDLKRMIRSLLKRQPTERVSFEGFFRSVPVVSPIPGLVGEDLPKTSNVPKPDPEVSELSRRMQKQSINAPAQTRRSDSPTAPPIAQDTAGPATYNAVRDADAPAVSDNGRRPSQQLTARKSSLAGGSRPMDINQPSNRHERPAMVAHATAPAREYLMGGQYGQSLPRQSGEMQRYDNRRTGPAPTASAPKEPGMMDSAKHSSRDRTMHEARERTAQDLAFEREYVMIEKRAVEVNAFADELARYGGARQQQGPNHGAMVRRVTTQGIPTSSTGAQASNPSNALQTSTGRRPDSLHARRPSFERRYAPNPTSATNMLSKALNMANARLFGVLGGSPPLGSGPSPPRGYGAFPTYPTIATPLQITDGRDNAPLDEDAKILRTVEEAATRSDTVYSFAEVKYRQLLPATPSADEGLGIQQIGALEKPLQGSEDDNDPILTQNAVIAVSEEALVLFMKALAVLTKSVDLAGYWWKHQNRGELTPESSPSRAADSRANAAEVGKRMNNVVQWARNRFNECFEKSEVVGRRLVEAQKLLPPDHPGHPNNHTTGSGSGSANSVGTSTEQIQLSSGVTAEKLMFDRAVEMSRAAAVNELVGEDLKGCELSYRTAIILLEAVLESDDEPLMPRPSANKDKAADELVNGMESEDRQTVIDLINGTRQRLRALCRKIQAQISMERRLSTGPPQTQRLPARSSPSPSALPGTSPR